MTTNVEAVVEDKHGTETYSRNLEHGESLDAAAIIAEAFPDDEFEEVDWRQEANGLYDFCVVFYIDETRHSSTGFNRIDGYD